MDLQLIPAPRRQQLIFILQLRPVHRFAQHLCINVPYNVNRASALYKRFDAHAKTAQRT
jgi:hypothetical protein